MLGHEVLEASGEGGHVLHLHREAGGVGVPSEALQQVAAVLDSLVDVEAGDRARRAGGQVARAGQHHGGAVVDFRQARGHDADDTLVPRLVVEHDGAAVGEVRQLLHDVVGLLGHGLVQVLARLVILVDLPGFLQCGREVLLRQQVHRLLAVLYASRGVDARPYLEDDVAHGDFLVRQPAHVDDGLHPHAGVGVQLLQPVVGQDAVFAHDGHNVRRDAHRHQVQQGNEVVEFNAVAHGECLHELEPHAAARQVLVGIRVVKAFGVEDGHGGRQFVIRHVVVADDEVDAFLTGIRYLLHGLDAAVQHDNQLHTRPRGIVHALHRHSIALFIAVRDVIVDVGVILLDKLVDQRDGRGAVHVIVAVNQYPFLSAHCPVQAFHGYVHILHQERVVQFGELGAEEFPRRLDRGDATLHQQPRQYRADAQCLRQLPALFCLFGCNGQVIPFVRHYIYCLFFFLFSNAEITLRGCPERNYPAGRIKSSRDAAAPSLPTSRKGRKKS